MLRSLLGAILSIAAFVRLTPCLSAAQRPENLCTNGGFELLDESGFPKDWSGFHTGTLGTHVIIGLSDDSHSGKRSFSFVVNGTDKAGLNRRYSPGTDVGALIPLVKGTARFWYKAIRSASNGDNLRFYVIAMDERGTSEVARQSYVVRAVHVGDGQWHEGTLDFDFSANPAARYVHAAPRVNEGGRASPGEILFDDVVVTRVGVRLEVTSFGPDRAVARVGDEIVFCGTIKNVGDEAARSVQTTLLLDGANVGDAQSKSRLKPEETASFEWRYPAGKEMSAVAQMVVRAQNADPLSSVSYLGALPERPAPADVVVEGESVKLAFGCTVYGYGPARLFIRSGTGWYELARLMSLSRLAYRSQDGTIHRRLLCGDIANFTKVRARFARDLVDADGDVWHFRFSFNAGDDGKSIRAEYTLRTENDEELLAFGGPALYVGDGTSRNEKDDALFPGLEYLESDEVSSGTLDVSPPQNVRRVPHPNKVTIPLMAVNVRQHLIGLRWDPLQKWDGTNDRPCALFASPNWLENMQCHTLALFLPSCPKWVAENAMDAAQPYELQAGRELKLVVEIFVDYPVKSSIEAVQRWIELNGVPTPFEPPRGTLQEEIDFSLKAYTHTLWVEDDQKWHNTLDWDPWGLRVNPVFVHQLLLGARRTSNDEQRQLYRERISSALDRMSGTERGLDLAFAAGRVREAFAAETSMIEGLIESQYPKGYWIFDPDKWNAQDTIHHKDYHLLGKKGDVEVGICANSAYRILKFARISGNSRASDAGLRALGYMRTFRVPRAAQVWEVPVHAPDVLASAHAVLAYLEGFKLTGEQSYLDDAIRWARTGLPFIYMWNNADMPYMCYASIPVFGATWLTHGWFGRAVQWNGLDYAHALLKLSEHDATFPWREIATGITISAMYQQEENGRYAALYPDSYDFMTRSKATWWLSPSGILRNALTLLGDDPDVKTAVVENDGETVRVSSGARIENASRWRRGLSFDLVVPPGETSYCIVVPVAQPDKVTSNRSAVKQVMDLEAAEEAWSYDGVNKALFIKILHRQERMRVLLRIARR